MLPPRVAFLASGLFFAFDMWLVFALLKFGLRFLSDPTFAAIGAVTVNAFFVMFCQWAAINLYERFV
jgi:hypothetical protein